ncbi:uncharacterized protein C5orf52 homolog [Python bivittatus]|uniref:Uncharacterized protein C5orf52 homolog n=1 Tax=Python bivittatus TaxID=176946 RepID=A0A9F5IYT7_PYTBI|nr:uncharacterized protein C5orf52 homolog [Python bivittatus]
MFSLPMGSKAFSPPPSGKESNGWEELPSHSNGGLIAPSSLAMLAGDTGSHSPTLPEEEEESPGGAQEPLSSGSQQNCSETALKTFLPKSHLAQVIIRDNVSVQRVQDVKVRHIEESKRKVENLFDQMKKRFIHDQQKKTFRWKKEYSHYQRMLEEIDKQNLTRQLGSSLKLLESQKSSMTGRFPKPDRVR